MAEWTILVFLNAKNDLEPFAFPNFAQMAGVGSTPDVNVLVEMGRPLRHYTDDYGAWSKTLRFRVEKDMLPVESSALEDLGAVNMGDGGALEDFVAWGRQNYPARKTMLVIWNHGQGWRVRQATRFLGESAVVDRYRTMRRDMHAADATRAGETPALADGLQVPGGVRYVSNDEDTGDKLYNREIQDTLLGLLRGEKLDVIAFDACLMAMVETAHALRDVGQVLVGSEELEPGTGWNYERWLRPLVDARGDIDPAGLGRLMVKGYEEEYGDFSQTTLSAVDLSKASTLSASISAFAETALPLLAPASVELFRKARAACANYAPGYGLHSIDLGRYMEQIEKSTLDPTLRQRAGEVRARLNEAVLANYASAARMGRWGSNGLAIYYPHSRFAHQSDPDGAGYDPSNQHYPVEFVQTEKWASFLHRYWELVP